jgi:hypothetical protein
MGPWTIFIVGILLLALVFLGGFLLNRYRHQGVNEADKTVEDERILHLLLGLASLSILAYIAFTFGKR